MSAQPHASALVSADPWRDLAVWIEQATGLHFSRTRDLRRVFHSAAIELGFEDDVECAKSLLQHSPELTRAAAPGSSAQAATLQTLVRHLTVGETYFFRDRGALDALESGVLIPLIAARRRGIKFLRIWCAACCTGEEAYTLAIMLHRLLPDIAEWDISLAATDINESFLKRARAASYGEWSFRDAPPWLRTTYFTVGSDGRSTPLPHIARMVHFSALNLVAQSNAVPAGLRAMDVVLCRNALMYFSAPQITHAVGRLTDALVSGGCLVVGPTETPCVVHPHLVRQQYPEAMLLRKFPPGIGAELGNAAGGAVIGTGDASATAMRNPRTARELPGLVTLLAAAAEAETTVEPKAIAGTSGASRAKAAAHWADEARSLAGQGQLAEALACCDRWLAVEKLDTQVHYVRAAVLLEAGDTGAARLSLRRALYVDSGFVLAHVALGQLERTNGNADMALRHFTNAQELLQGREPADELPDAEGMTAGQVLLTLNALIGTLREAAELGVLGAAAESGPSDRQVDGHPHDLNASGERR